MASDSHLRAIGLLERFHTTRHFLGLDTCVVASAKYATQDGLTLTKDILFAALCEVIKVHPSLGVKLENESTSSAAFTRLQTIDLSHLVQFTDNHNLQTALESQLAQAFDTDADFPLWRIQVLTDNTVILAMHHVIGDGLSAIAFHASLLDALRNSTARDASSFARIPNTTSLSPPIEAVTSLRPSLGTIIAEVLKLYAPKSWTRARFAWSGNPVQKAPSLKTNLRLMSFPPQEVAAFCDICRTHRASLTSAFYVLTVAIISRMIARDPARYKTISSAVPISLREICGIPRDVMCDYASAHYTYPRANPEFTWAAAARYAVELRKQKSKARENVGMLRFLSRDYVPYMTSHLGTKRASGFALSNLGRFDAPTAEGTWNIGHTVFAQCDVVIGAAFKLNVVCDPSGAMNVALTWGDQSIATHFIESFIPQFQKAFRDLLEY
ncbi:alcohol acetyltransferase [Mycena vulgaris]|nr:alcohol acetyltransferase [Mycena vulgaris]